jgi:hypothetical protein
MIVMLQTIFGRHQVKTLYWAQKKQLLMFPLKRSCIDGLLMFPILDDTEKGLEIMIRNRSAKCYENSSTLLLCAHQIHFLFISECKERIVANLSNFAYDPYNYAFMRQVDEFTCFLFRSIDYIADFQWALFWMTFRIN